QVDTRQAMSPRLIVDLIHRPLWLMAIAGNLVGFGLQVTALKFGSLALVQPLLVCQLSFAVLIARIFGWKTYGPPWGQAVGCGHACGSCRCDSRHRRIPRHRAALGRKDPRQHRRVAGAGRRTDRGGGTLPLCSEAEREPGAARAGARLRVQAIISTTD